MHLTESSLNAIDQIAAVVFTVTLFLWVFTIWFRAKKCEVRPGETNKERRDREKKKLGRWVYPFWAVDAWGTLVEIAAIPFLFWRFMLPH